MAIFRKIHVSFWKDPFVKKLSPDKKLFYLYLMTNSCTKQCGIYEIDLDTIVHETGYSIDTVYILLQYFIDTGKIQYSKETEEIAIKNWLKYNDSTSPKVFSCVEKELKLVKNTVLIEYLYTIHTETQEEQEEETEQEYSNKKNTLIVKIGEKKIKFKHNGKSTEQVNNNTSQGERPKFTGIKPILQKDKRS